MQLYAWRIVPVMKMTPWIIPLERAVEIFGQAQVDQIGEEPVAVELQILI